MSFWLSERLFFNNSLTLNSDSIKCQWVVGKDTIVSFFTVLKELRSTVNPKLRDASRGILHQLGIIDIYCEADHQTRSSSSGSRSQSSRSRPTTLGSRSRLSESRSFHSMLHPHVSASYTPCNDQLSMEYARKGYQGQIRSHRFNVWIDIEKMGEFCRHVQ